MTNKNSREALISDLQRRVEDRILEPSNYELLKKLIEKADSLDEAIMISELGTTYKRTGFHFDKRLEKMTDTIKYFKKNEQLSFSDGTDGISNKLIIGDNYDALLNLLIEYRGKMDVIYIDPPYGKDNMGDFADTNYENSITRDNLLSMLYPRLLLSKLLLCDDGIIFCSIDDKNEAYVKCLFDEVFGETNFRTLITVVANPGGKDYGGIAKTTEFVLAYAKSSETELSKISDKSHSFEMEDDYGKFELRELRNRNTKFNIDNRPNLCYPFYVAENDVDEYELYSISLEKDSKHTIEVFPLKSQGIQTVWRWGKEERSRANININIKAKKKKDGTFMIVEKYRDERVMLKNLILSDKCYRTEAGSLEFKDIMKEKELFDYPKPVDIPKKLISVKDNTDAIILDFFAGSGTTGQAVLELNKEDDGNRKFILCTNNEITDKNPNGIAYDVTTKRLKRTMTGSCYDGSTDFAWIKSNKPLGGSLDVYEIAEVANFEASEGKTPFDVIDETLYGKEKFKTIQEKIEWVCNNFEKTQKKMED